MAEPAARPSAPTWPGPAPSTTSGNSTRPSRRPVPPRRCPATQDAATVVLARAHLERYREQANPDDLSRGPRSPSARCGSADLDARDRRRLPDGARRGAVLRRRLRRGGHALRERHRWRRRGGRPQTGESRCSTGGAAPSSATPMRSTASAHRAACSPDLRERMSNASWRAAPAPRRPPTGLVVATARRRRIRRPPGTPRSPAGCGPGWPARDRRRCAPISTSSCWKASFPTASTRCRRSTRRAQAESDLRGEWAVVKERWK